MIISRMMIRRSFLPPMLLVLPLMTSQSSALLMSPSISNPKLMHPYRIISLSWEENDTSSSSSSSSSSSFHRRSRDSSTRTRMKYKSPDEKNSYNDDAFGLVFLIGGILSQDVEFASTFAALSAIAASGTNIGLFNKDERAPAVVAMLTLLVSPVISSLRQTESLEQIVIVRPLPVELGLCFISCVWAFWNWYRIKWNT